ncbi:flavin reductase family protein [Rathayibacter sp. KR2-224]|uniref:flavin reductase family protein n=1 Tax=Rathayibacter sp. KR2-224 TaxID=3400913 RepID=UPI003C04D4B7
MTLSAVTSTTDPAPIVDGGVASSPSFEGLTPEEFKLAFRHHPAGVALITADAGDGPVALTATSVFSVSAEPPLFVFSISDQSSSSQTIIRAATVVVHLLSAEQLALAKLGAARGVDRFADADSWKRLVTGEPYFTAAGTWIRGKVIDRMRAGGSTVIAAHAVQAHLPDADGDAGSPLVYHSRTWHALGAHSRLE